MSFIDRVKIQVSSGNGGPGAVSFHREKYVPRGGPDGGDGGRGGHVVFQVDKNLRTLFHFENKKKFHAENGEGGKNNHKQGAQGEDLILKVPHGTVIRQEDGHLIKDLSHEEPFVFLKGGQGGKGNAFYKSSVHQAPQIAQKGRPGKKETLLLELKLIADVGLVGFPNVGKSTLLSHVSASRPKIGNYPFTTLEPSLGVVSFGDEESFIMADIPGMIEGAHKGVGLGLDFLGHVERTSVLLHVLEPETFSHRKVLEDYEIIRHEIVSYDERNTKPPLENYIPLKDRPELVVLNKSDALSEEEVSDVIQDFAKKQIDVLPISAVTGYNIKTLLQKVKPLLDGDSL